MALTSVHAWLSQTAPLIAQGAETLEPPLSATPNHSCRCEDRGETFELGASGESVIGCAGSLVCTPLALQARRGWQLIA
jgi:hypothetical protein